MKTRRVNYLTAHRRRESIDIPYIRLRGRWLQASGFTIGRAYSVRIEFGNLILTPES